MKMLGRAINEDGTDWQSVAAAMTQSAGLIEVESLVAGCTVEHSRAVEEKAEAKE